MGRLKTRSMFTKKRNEIKNEYCLVVVRDTGSIDLEPDYAPSIAWHQKLNETR